MVESTGYPNEADSDSHLLTEYEGFCAMRPAGDWLQPVTLVA